MNVNEKEDSLEIDLGKLFGYFWSNWVKIAVVSLLTALIAFLATHFLMTPLYRASITVYVNNNRSNQSVESITGGNLSAAQQLVSTYTNIIKSNTVLKDVIEAGDLQYGPGQLRGMMTAQQMGKTEMFQVSISHPNPEMAAYIANTVADVAPAAISSVVEGSSAKIIDYASVPAAPYTPNNMKNILVGGVTGFVLCCAVLLLRYLFDMRLKNEEDLASYFSAPVLGVIPEFADDTVKHRRNYGYGSDSTKAKGGR